MGTPNDMKSLIDSMTMITKRFEEDANERKALLDDSKEMKGSLGQILQEVVGVREKMEKNTSRLDFLEKEKRKRNLLVFGVEEKEDETMRDLEETIMEIARIIKSDLRLVEVDYISRMGKKKNDGKNRPVILSLTTLRRKIEMIANKKYLKDTNYYLKEHYTKEIVEKRKVLNKEVMKLREEGKYAVVKFDKLVVKENYQQSGRSSKKRPAVDSISPEMKEQTGSTAPRTVKKLLPRNSLRGPPSTTTQSKLDNYVEINKNPTSAVIVFSDSSMSDEDETPQNQPEVTIPIQENQVIVQETK